MFRRYLAKIVPELFSKNQKKSYYMRLPYFIIHCPWLHYDGMALFPFILLKRREYRDDVVLLHHERIHLQQQWEMGVVLFYVVYLLNYIANLWRYRHHDTAYRRIVFEQEAYDHEADLDYLRGRRAWAWWRYFFKQKH